MRIFAETKSSKFPKAKKKNGESKVKGGKRMESQRLSVSFFLRMAVLLSPLSSTRNRKQSSS